MITGLYRPSSGPSRLRLAVTLLASRPKSHCPPGAISRTFQTIRLFSNMTVLGQRPRGG